MTNLADLVSRVEKIPDASDEQHAAAYAYVRACAPDLVEAIWGATS